MTSSALTLATVGSLSTTVAGPVIDPPSATPVLPAITVRLNGNNFMLWRAHALPNLAGARLHGFLDGSAQAPSATIKEGTGTDARDVVNPDYAQWWTMDQKVLGHLLGSMHEDISAQLIGCTSAAAAWSAVHAKFSAENRAGVRALRRQIQGLRKGDKSASEYMQKVKALADAMAAAGSPLRDDEIIEYMLAGLGPAYNPIAASMDFAPAPVTLAVFYKNVLNFESLQKQQAESEDWTSSANLASRPVHLNNPGRTYDSNRPSGGRPADQGAPQGQIGYGQGGQGGQDRRRTDGNGNGGNARNNGGGGNGGGNGRNRRWRPQCQICDKWGHDANDCRRRYDRDQRSGNGASTSSNDNEQYWHLDTGATDHLTSDLERLHVHERYGGKDQEQMAAEATPPSAPAEHAPVIDVHAEARDPAPHAAPSPAPAASCDGSTCASPAAAASLSAAPVPDQPASPSVEGSSTATPTAAPGHAMVTRARDNTRRERMYTDGTVRYDPSRRAFFATPVSHRDALRETAWRAAMAEEVAALHHTRTWVLVPRPPGVNVVGCKWIFKTKHRPDGSIDKHKARLVARGFTQRHGIDYGDTFSPVVKPATVRLVLSLAVSRGWSLRQINVSNAFLHGFLSEDVYMQQPPGFEDDRYPSHVCKLQRALYGLKQSPRAWYARLSALLVDLGFVPSKADTSLFTFSRDGVQVYMLVYVDDIVIAGSTPGAVDGLVRALSASFPIKDLGTLEYFLGLEASYNSGGMTITQRKYALDLLHRVSCSAACRVLDFRPEQACYSCSDLLAVPWPWAAARSSCLLCHPAQQIPPNFPLIAKISSGEVPSNSMVVA
ncbi:hypothetical protein QYE76_007892 [Lolium multiflorum]|uniref:Reverse transcriptase Ty1/copia-type domain-containing protein n=1 Tax=Lolium multiflorum TaxID=4521 RepID=A0AAD8VDH0_LOLMU|nr:hypothetical protein QYE76_007892 [Lolium multiflorum]